MKKITIILLSAVMALSVCACGGGSKPAETTSAEATTEETTSSAVETTLAVVSKKEGHWKTELSLDEFGDITEESTPIISGYFEGDFSNTATLSSELKVNVLNDENLFGFYLYEYGKTKASFLGSEEKILKIKIADDTTEDKLEETGGGGLACSWTVGNLISKSLKADIDVRCIIEVGSSKYNFTMLSDNYDDAISEKERIIDDIYSEAEALFEQGEYKKALKKFDVIKDYRDASKYTDSLTYLPKKIEYEDGRAREYKYDSDGNVISYILHKADGTTTTYNYEYSDGKLRSMTYLNTEVAFSNDGKSSKEILTGKDNTFVFLNNYTYDDNGLVKEIVREKEPDQEAAFLDGLTEFRYEYDTNGLITAVERDTLLHYDNENPSIAKQKSHMHTDFIYDENGILISVNETYKNNEMNWKVVDVEYIYPKKNYNNFIKIYTWYY